MRRFRCDALGATKLGVIAENALENERLSSESSAKSKDFEERGVIYIALCSRRYLALCACSVQSLRWAGYEGAIRVLVDDIGVVQAAFADLNVELVQVEEPSKEEMSSRCVKTQLYDYAPWSHTLYLDCDIIALRDPTPLWNDFGAADLALAKAGYNGDYSVADCVHGTRRERDWTLQQGVDGAQFDGGVMLWRCCPETRTFFEHWNREWQRFKDIDQLALLRALHSSKTVAQTLPRIYNCAAYSSVLSATNEGVVFLHALGGRDVDTFRAAFGTLFDEKCRLLQISRRDLKKTYYVFSLKRGSILWPLLLRAKMRRLKSRAGNLVRRLKR